MTPPSLTCGPPDMLPCRASHSRWRLSLQRAALGQRADTEDLPFSMDAVAEELNLAYGFHELPADAIPPAWKWLASQGTAFPRSPCVYMHLLLHVALWGLAHSSHVSRSSLCYGATVGPHSRPPVSMPTPPAVPLLGARKE